MTEFLAAHSVIVGAPGMGVVSRAAGDTSRASPFKEADLNNEESGKPKGHTGNSRPDTELPYLTNNALTDPVFPTN